MNPERMLWEETNRRTTTLTREQEINKLMDEWLTSVGTSMNEIYIMDIYIWFLKSRLKDFDELNKQIGSNAEIKNITIQGKYDMEFIFDWFTNKIK